MLPPSIGDLTVAGMLNLRKNELKSLPESFGSLTVGGKVHVSGNQVVESLHENSFPGLTLVL